IRRYRSAVRRRAIEPWSQMQHRFRVGIRHPGSGGDARVREPRSPHHALLFQNLDYLDCAARRWWLAAAPAHAAARVVSVAEGSPERLAPGIVRRGGLRLATSRFATEPPPLTNTMGMVEVAALAARMVVFWPTIAAPCRCTRSAASAGSRSNLFSAQRNSIAT